MCDLICSVKSCQDDGAVDGEVVSRTHRESWAGAGIDKLIAVHATGTMSLALSGMSEKHTVVPPGFCTTGVTVVSLTVITFRFQRFLLFISALALAICSCSLLHSLAAAVHCLDSGGGVQVEFSKVIAVWGQLSWFRSGECSPHFIEVSLIWGVSYSDEIVLVIIRGGFAHG